MILIFFFKQIKSWTCRGTRSIMSFWHSGAARSRWQRASKAHRASRTAKMSHGSISIMRSACIQSCYIIRIILLLFRYAFVRLPSVPSCPSLPVSATHLPLWYQTEIQSWRMVCRHWLQWLIIILFKFLWDLRICADYTNCKRYSLYKASPHHKSNICSARSPYA